VLEPVLVGDGVVIKRGYIIVAPFDCPSETGVYSSGVAFVGFVLDKLNGRVFGLYDFDGIVY